MHHSSPSGAQRFGHAASEIAAQTAVHGQHPAQSQHLGHMGTYFGTNVAVHGRGHLGTEPAHHAATQADLNFSGALARLNETEGVIFSFPCRKETC
jgi:hypothetical protein